jgi:DNA-binding NtrC family response regulator
LEGQPVSRTENRRVLIVDDEYVIADTLATIFTLAGYEARAAYSAEKAFELIAGWPPHFAIVDVVLPAMNGSDFAILLKATIPGSMVRLFSGQLDTSRLLEEGRRNGHTFEVLAKPVHPSEFLHLASEFFPPSDVSN